VKVPASRSLRCAVEPVFPLDLGPRSTRPVPAAPPDAARGPVAHTSSNRHPSRPLHAFADAPRQPSSS
jgi:hypothetical protein